VLRGTTEKEKMKAMIMFLVALIVTTLNVFGELTVTSPTPGQVFYPGETMQIRWTSELPSFYTASILLHEAGVGSRYIESGGQKNNGRFDWVVEKRNSTGTNFVISIYVGVSVEESNIPIIIQNGVRPPQPVEVSLFRGVVIEWVSIPGHTYRIEKSTNSIDWEIIAEEVVDFTPAYIVDYTEGRKVSHRVLDITNGAQPVEIQVSRSVSLEWTSIPGHTYRVVKSTDLVNWETMAEGTVDFTEAYFDDYAEDPHVFYRVLDITPSS